MTRTPPVVAGLLLTGGGSTRLGTEKAMLATPGGETLAQRTARLLNEVAAPVLEVGPGRTGLPVVDDEGRQGPLAAVAAGVAALDAMAVRALTLVVATDLPRLDAGTLHALARFPGDGSVIPLVDGVPQVLCARYDWNFLASAVEAFDRGERSLRRVVAGSDVALVDEGPWAGADRAPLADVDTPAELRRMIASGALRDPACKDDRDGSGRK